MENLDNNIVLSRNPITASGDQLIFNNLKTNFTTTSEFVNNVFSSPGDFSTLYKTSVPQSAYYFRSVQKQPRFAPVLSKDGSRIATVNNDRLVTESESTNIDLDSNTGSGILLVKNSNGNYVREENTFEGHGSSMSGVDYRLNYNGEVAASLFDRDTVVRNKLYAWNDDRAIQVQSRSFPTIQVWAKDTGSNNWSEIGSGIAFGGVDVSHNIIIHDWQLNDSGNLVAVCLSHHYLGAADTGELRYNQLIYKLVDDNWKLCHLSNRYPHDRVAINNSGNIVAFSNDGSFNGGFNEKVGTTDYFGRAISSTSATANNRVIRDQVYNISPDRKVYDTPEINHQNGTCEVFYDYQNHGANSPNYGRISILSGLPSGRNIGLTDDQLTTFDTLPALEIAKNRFGEFNSEVTFESMPRQPKTLKFGSDITLNESGNILAVSDTGLNSDSNCYVNFYNLDIAIENKPAAPTTTTTTTTTPSPFLVTHLPVSGFIDVYNDSWGRDSRPIMLESDRSGHHLATVIKRDRGDDKEERIIYLEKNSAQPNKFTTKLKNVSVSSGDSNVVRAFPATHTSDTPHNFDTNRTISISRDGNISAEFSRRSINQAYQDRKFSKHLVIRGIGDSPATSTYTAFDTTENYNYANITTSTGYSYLDIRFNDRYGPLDITSSGRLAYQDGTTTRINTKVADTIGGFTVLDQSVNPFNSSNMERFLYNINGCLINETGDIIAIQRYGDVSIDIVRSKNHGYSKDNSWVTNSKTTIDHLLFREENMPYAEFSSSTNSYATAITTFRHRQCMAMDARGDHIVIGNQLWHAPHDHSTEPLTLANYSKIMSPSQLVVQDSEGIGADGLAGYDNIRLNANFAAYLSVIDNTISDSGDIFALLWRGPDGGSRHYSRGCSYSTGFNTGVSSKHYISAIQVYQSGVDASSYVKKLEKIYVNTSLETIKLSGSGDVLYYASSQKQEPTNRNVNNPDYRYSDQNPAPRYTCGKINFPEVGYINGINIKHLLD